MKMTKYMTSIILIILSMSKAFATISTPFNSNDTSHILQYIEASWKKLTRSMNNMRSLVDPKTHRNMTLYLPADMPTPLFLKNIQPVISIKHLPQKIHHLGEIDADAIHSVGLLYLPHPYVVPGGMFNEMYGWDSYFIIRGLLESKHINLAKGMIENLFFEIDHYGAILNANRTYYLTRSQPPFLSSMIRSLYEIDQPKNLRWLEKAYLYAKKDYHFWVKKPHLAGDTRLSRYYDFHDGPVPELDDSAKSYYIKIRKFFTSHPIIGNKYLNHNGELNNLFYKGDRAMRESGYDTSFRFGPFSADTINYAPVELNSLLYKAEKDLQWISLRLHKNEEAVVWQKRAASRRHFINKYLWNEKEGFYFDYDFVHKKQSSYLYATSFFPLWAGISSPHQAKRMRENLKYFSTKNGLTMSPYQTGAQWDYPYGWAPLQLIIIEGLYQHGFKDKAVQLSRSYLAMVMKNFKYKGNIWEKYNIVTGSAKTNISVGYKINVLGFGWTNGVFLVLLHHYA